MKKKQALTIVLWLIGLAAAHLFLFLLPKEQTESVWITYGFTLFAFLSQLVLWFFVGRGAKTAEQRFLHLPLLSYSVAYLAVQLILCLLFALVRAAAKTAILVNALLLLAAAALLAISLLGASHAAKIDQRQKDHHIKL